MLSYIMFSKLHINSLICRTAQLKHANRVCPTLACSYLLMIEASVKTKYNAAYR